MFGKKQPLDDNNKLHMKYNVENERYRDVYNERDRTRRKPKSHMSQKGNRNTGYFTFGGLMLTGAFGYALTREMGSFLMKFAGSKQADPGYLGYMLQFVWPANKFWWILSLGIPAMIAFGAYSTLERNRKLLEDVEDTSTLNEWEGDSRITQPEELARKFDIFPDVAMHSPIAPTALLGHLFLSNKGIKKVDVTKRYKNDTTIEYDDGTQEIAHADDPVLDDEGEIETQSLPLFDTKFAEDLYDASGVPKSSHVQHFYDPRELIYNDNPAEHLGKPKYKTVAEEINHDWTMPTYEVGRPAGAYVVDTDPNNTMVLAMTRAGKGDGPAY